MELTSAPLHKGQVPWRGLLLAALLLTYWTSPTTAQLTIEALPPYIVEGINVLLVVHNPPPNFKGFYWYKGTTATSSGIEIGHCEMNSRTKETGPAYSGRETLYFSGNLHFQNITQNDALRYQIVMVTQDFRLKYARVKLQVYERVTLPFIQVTNPTVKELDSVVMTCSSIDTGISISWLFKGQSLELTDRMKLSQNNSILTIDPVRSEDSGDYQCEVSSPVISKRSDPIQLDIIDQVTPPFIQITNTTFNYLLSAVLTCFSKDTGISISWLFNGQSLDITDRMKLSQNNRTLSIDPVRTEDSGEYQCEISNAVSSKRSDPIQLDIIQAVFLPFMEVTNTRVKELNPVFLTCSSKDTGISISWLFNGQSLDITDRMKLSQNNRTLRIDPVRREDSGDYQCEVSNPVSSKRSDPIQLDIIPNPTQGSSDLSWGVIVSIVAGSVVAVNLISSMMYFIYFRKSRG